MTIPKRDTPQAQDDAAQDAEDSKTIKDHKALQNQSSIDPEDYPAFAAQIHRFLTLSPEQRTEEGRRCRAYVEREYTWDQTAAQYMDLFTRRT